VSIVTASKREGFERPRKAVCVRFETGCEKPAGLGLRPPLQDHHFGLIQGQYQVACRIQAPA